MLQESWHIRSRARECAASGKPFEEGETIVTALFPDPDSSGYLRRDYTLEAWEQREADAEPPFSSWRARYQPPPREEKPDPMRKEDPEALLRRLVDEDEEHTETIRYILAVMLERQKLLRETDTQPIPSGILRVYEHRKTGDAFLIRDPQIPLAEVERVQQEVVLLLEHGGRLPPAEPADEDAPATEDAPAADTAPGTDAADPEPSPDDEADPPPPADPSA